MVGLSIFLGLVLFGHLFDLLFDLISGVLDFPVKNGRFNLKLLRIFSCKGSIGPSFFMGKEIL
jgi:hypothetical protein